jgi:hypothetical protein
MKQEAFLCHRKLGVLLMYAESAQGKGGETSACKTFQVRKTWQATGSFRVEDTRQGTGLRSVQAA